MKTIRNMLFIYLYGVIRINDFQYGKNPEKKIRIAIIDAISVTAGLVLFIGWFIYTVRLEKSIPSSELFHILLAPMIALTGFICFFFAIFRGIGFVFLDNDIEQLLCSPMRTKNIVIGKTLIVYLFNVLISLFLLLPPFIVYGLSQSQMFFYYVFAFFTICFIPALSVMSGICFGVLISMIFKGLQIYKNRILTILILTLIIIMLTGSFFVKGVDLDFMIRKILQLLSQLFVLYSYTSYYLNSVTLSGLLYFLLSLTGLMIISIIYITIMTLYYKKIYSAIHYVERKKSLIVDKRFRANIPLYALYNRELKRYFSSTMYVANTMIGVILSFVFTLLLILKNEYIYLSLNSINYFTDIKDKYHGFIIVILSILICLTNTADCSISLEGKHFFILKTYPITSLDIFISKIAVNLTLTIPAAIVNALILAIVFKLKAIELLLIFQFPISFAILTAIFGLFINLLLPRFDWTNEVAIVKQSMSSIIGIFGGIALIAVPSFIIFKYSGRNTIEYLLILSTVTLILSFVSLLLLNKYGNKRILKI